MTEFAQLLAQGIAWGSVYALIALGYTMVHGVLRLINFAHGDVYMVGAFIGFYAITYAHLGLLWALVAAMVGCAALGKIGTAPNFPSRDWGNWELSLFSTTDVTSVDDNWAPRIVAWEITRRCDLACKHCRARADAHPDPLELSPADALDVVRQVAQAGTELLILSGGDPLLRADWPEIAANASAAGIRVTMAPNGLHVNAAVAARMCACGIQRAAISLDFPTPRLHDQFRGVAGAFDAAVRALRLLREAGVECQVNSTITALNVDYLDALIDLSLELGARAFHPFLLVETGRAEGLADRRLTPERCEEMMQRLRRRQVELQGKLAFKPTDMPQFCRVMAQDGARSVAPPSADMSAAGLDHVTRGCQAGRGFCFISSRGEVNPCGYLPLPAGNVRLMPLAEIWRESALLQALRDDTLLQGKCGACEFKGICGGCRARAFAQTGDWMASEPLCTHVPRTTA